MSCYITLPFITGTPPYEITICDNNGNNCFLAAYETTFVPPTIYVQLPESWGTLPFVLVTVQSSEGCEEVQFIMNTPTPTSTNTPTPTPTPTPNTSVTPTPTPTVTPTPSTILPIPPFFQVQNIVGTNPMIVNFTSAPTSSFNINWGDGSTYPVSITNPPYPASYTGYTYTHNYGASLYTATFEDFQVSSSISTNNIREIKLYNISDIIENSYTFSAFTAATDIWLSATTLTDFSSSLPNSLVDFYIYNTNAPGSQNFQFSPTTNLATLPVFRELLIQNTDISGLTYNFSGSSSFRSLTLITNNSLTDLNVTVPTGSTFLEIYIVNNTSLPILNVTNNLSGCTGLNDIQVFGNTSLSGWTYTVPVSTQDLRLSSNTIREFNIDLTANTNLTSLRLDSNIVLSSFTNSISACTSLTTLRLDRNNLTSLPPVFPNSIQTLRLDINNFTGYTSNFPTGCVTFNMSDTLQNQYVPQWTVDLTGATSLTTFQMEDVSLSGWTTQFPTSIRTINLDGNLMTNFDFNYTLGATNISLRDNLLTGTTNLSAHTSIVTLTIASNNFINSSQIIQGNFPSTLRTFSMGNSTLTGWSSTFSAMTNVLSLDFRGSSLKTASVDYILQDVASIATANTLYNKTLLFTGTSFPQPESPTGGLTNPYYLLLKNSPYNWNITVKP
jgi:hypothetical protein